MTPVEGESYRPPNIDGKVQFEQAVPMPKLPQLETCCCCCTTETGSKIIGWLMTIVYIFMTITTGFWLVSAAMHVGEEIPTSPDNSTPPYKIEKIDVWQAAIGFGLSLLSLVLGIYLLLGIAKRNMSYVKVWLTFMTIYLVIFAFFLVLTVVQSISSHSVGPLVMELINFCILSYCVLVVYSFYRDQRQSPSANY
ncbi:uncharacterized protein LOC106666407 [Cimex lectularius]|uniref:Uncharacterized protein n=1 Tax=Cimex lectularius TaxID=79782 RepID=A0A8I6RPC6_CIMLE|nr:uncharacterized protein LOC106666407 [Cimex lectularius]